MKRGEVWWVAFDPAVGSEIRKTRPAVIVSNDAANRPMVLSGSTVYPKNKLTQGRAPVVIGPLTVLLFPQGHL